VSRENILGQFQAAGIPPELQYRKEKSLIEPNFNKKHPKMSSNRTIFKKMVL
jgi:hypothetical protein